MIAKCLDVKSTTSRRYTGSISKVHLADLLGIPQSARIYVSVPTGGDWSDEELDIKDAPIYVEWIETD